MGTPNAQATRSKHTQQDVLVEPGWLEAHLADPAVRVIEIDVSPAAYDEGHIEGAHLWNIYRDLKTADYHLVDNLEIERLLARSGITPDSTVVFYGYAPAMGFWLMKLYGHADVRILNCSRQTWQNQRRAWSADVPTIAPATYRLPARDGRIRADAAEVCAAIDDPNCTIVDVRSAPEFRGERFWPSGAQQVDGRAGHVPSALHVPIEAVHDDEGRFQNSTQLREQFASIDLSGKGALIAYCTIGGRACTAWFALTYLLGRDHVRVYDGSWAEWGRTPDVPVATP